MIRRRSKYNAKKTVLNGKVFHSRKEADRWLVLSLKEKAGSIRGLLTQYPIACIVNGTLICKYFADFAYFEGERLIVEDVKSPMTRKLPVYRLKKKLVLACRGIEILET